MSDESWLFRRFEPEPPKQPAVSALATRWIDLAFAIVGWMLTILLLGRPLMNALVWALA